MPFVQRTSAGAIFAVFAHQPSEVVTTPIDSDDPELLAFNAAFHLRADANAALTASNDVVSKYAETNTPLPDAWRAYRNALRAILAGTSTLTQLPAQPTTS